MEGSKYFLEFKGQKEAVEVRVKFLLDIRQRQWSSVFKEDISKTVEAILNLWIDKEIKSNT